MQAINAGASSLLTHTLHGRMLPLSTRSGVPILHNVSVLPLGATGRPQPADASVTAAPPAADRVRLAVVGAHLSGQPLNHQLVDRTSRDRGCQSLPEVRRPNEKAIEQR